MNTEKLKNAHELKGNRVDCQTCAKFERGCKIIPQGECGMYEKDDERHAAFHSYDWMRDIAIPTSGK